MSERRYRLVLIDTEPETDSPDVQSLRLIDARVPQDVAIHVAQACNLHHLAENIAGRQLDQHLAAHLDVVLENLRGLNSATSVVELRRRIDGAFRWAEAARDALHLK